MRIALFLCFSVLAVAAAAQRTNDVYTYFPPQKALPLGNPAGIPDASPYRKTEVVAGVDRFSVQYYSPSAKGRTLWGKEGVVPDGETWRIGANWATVLESTTEFVVENTTVPAGKYALFLIPDGDQWTFVLNKDHAQWGAYGHNPDEDVARITVPTATVAPPFENLVLYFNNPSFYGTQLFVCWGDRCGALPITLNGKFEQILTAFDTKMRAGSATSMDVYRAVNFCLVEENGLEHALKWATQSLSQTPNALVYYKRAQVHAYLDNPKLALQDLDAAEALIDAQPEGGPRLLPETVAALRESLQD